MTREEREAAIEYIKGYRKLDEDLHNTAPKDSVSYYATDKCLKYWDMAIKALSQEPTVTSTDEPMTMVYPTIVCDDAISREAVLSKINEVCFSKEWTQFRIDNGSNGQRDFLINYIEQLPPVTPQEPKSYL